MSVFVALFGLVEMMVMGVPDFLFAHFAAGQARDVLKELIRRLVRWSSHVASLSFDCAVVENCDSHLSFTQHGVKTSSLLSLRWRHL
jgi:hypothetical protein